MARTASPWFRTAGALLAAALAPLPAASAAQPNTPRPRQPDAGAAIELDFAEPVALEDLLDYISERLGINFVYDQQILAKRIAIKSPTAVPPAALLGLLDAALHVHGLAIIDGPGDAWRTIIPTADLAGVAPIDPAGQDDRNRPLVRVFRLEHAPPQRIETLVKPLLTRQGATTIALPEQSLLIVADFAANLRRIEKLIGLADAPSRSADVRFVPVRFASAPALAAQAKQILDVRTKGAAAAQGAGGPDLVADERTNQIVLIGEPADVEGALAVIAGLDVPVPEEQRPVRFYQLYNTTAGKVVETLRLIEGDQGEFSLGAPPSDAGHAGQPFAPAAYPADAGTDTPRPTIPQMQATDPSAGAGRPRPPGDGQPPRARVTADVHTNSVVVVGDPAIQAAYESIIRRLDKRRPQVLIETTLVILDTSDSFTLAVEVAATIGGNPRSLLFSAFGLSEVDPVSGRLTLNPGLGFNGAVLSADVADVVIRALKRNARAKVMSAPRLLVADNATGVLSSTNQQPYVSVNASDTVATTSFGGFVQAGTAITVTPHISDDDHLQLEYSVELSSFSGERVDNLPPPRQENKLESTVTLPDGATIVAGGLSRTDSSHSISAVPLLGDIPLLGVLFQSRQDSNAKSTLFVFIRPVVLRDDQFEDLRYISEQDRSAAGLPEELPASAPILF